jgi:integrase
MGAWWTCGKMRYRFRKKGFSTYLTGTPWGEEFMRQYAAAQDGEKSRCEDVGSTRTRPGSFDSICVAYYRSPEYQGLADATKTTYRGIIERFRKHHGKRRLRDLKRKHVKAIIGDMADRPQAANNLLSILKIMLDLAVDIEMMMDNLARGIKGFPKKTAGFHTWTDEEIAIYEARHPLGSKARLALALLLYTAQRRSDVVRMGWQHMRGDFLFTRQQKTGNECEIPLHPALVEALKSVPKSNMTFLTTSFGAPFTPAGLGNWFRDRCNEAGLKGCSAHGLRKAASRRLAEAGATANQIIAITGHANISEVTTYTREAESKLLATQGMEKVMRSFPEQKLVQPEKKVGQKRR